MLKQRESDIKIELSSQALSEHKCMGHKTTTDELKMQKYEIRRDVMSVGKSVVF